MALKERYKLLAIELAKGLPVQQAYINAGYSAKSANGNAGNLVNRLMENPEFRDYRESLEGNLIKERTMEAEDIIHEWEKIIKDDDVSVANRLKALDSLARSKNMFKEQIQVAVADYSEIINKARKRAKKNKK